MSQSNVAVGVAVGSARATPAAGPPPDSPPGAAVVSTPVISVPALSSLVVVAPVAVLSPILSVVSEAAEGIAAVDEALDLLLPAVAREPSLVLVPSMTGSAGSHRVGSFGAADGLRPAPFTVGPRGELAAPRPALGPVGSSVPALRAAPTEAHRAPPQSRTAKATKRSSRWKAPTGTSTTPERAPSGTSASAAGAAGSGSGSLPIFLALPFLAALLDLARRVAHERFATPSGHRSRVPDTPG